MRPWRVDPVSDAAGWLTILEDDGSEHGDRVATVYQDHHAQMIAAVPDMLATLELFEEHYGNVGNEEVNGGDMVEWVYSVFMPTVRASITKATGRKAPEPLTLLEAAKAALALLEDPEGDHFEANRVEAILRAAIAKEEGS